MYVFRKECINSTKPVELISIHKTENKGMCVRNRD